MRLISILVCVLLLELSASAQEDGASKAAPLLTPLDLQVMAAPKVFQASSRSSAAGSIYYPDQILATRIKSIKGEAKKVLSQWEKSHYFILIPFSIAVKPSEGAIPTRVDVGLSIKEGGDLSREPIIIDVWPKTGFEKGPVSGEVNINASGNFDPIPVKSVGNVDAEVKAALKVEYAPAYAKLISGFASSSAFWVFERSQKKYPVGKIPMKMLIAVPRNRPAGDVLVALDIRTKFSRALGFFQGSASASPSSIVRLPNLQ